MKRQSLFYEANGLPEKESCSVTSWVTGGGGGAPQKGVPHSHPGRCSVPAGGIGHFRLVCASCVVLSDPVSWEQGLQWGRGAGGHISVRGGGGRRKQNCHAPPHLTKKIAGSEQEPQLVTQQCQPWNCVSGPHISLTFVTSPCSRWVVSPPVAFHILISMKPLQTASPVLRGHQSRVRAVSQVPSHGGTCAKVPRERVGALTKGGMRAGLVAGPAFSA